MDRVQAKLDELKTTMPSETYRQLCEETKRVREDEVPLFEVKYVVNTTIATSIGIGEDNEIEVCNEVSTVHTKIMSGTNFRGWGHAKDNFIDGRLMLDEDTGELYHLYTPGTQFKIGQPHTKLKYSPYLTIYTIIEIKLFTNKRERIE